MANAGVSLANAFGYGPDREVDLDDALPPRQQRAETFISRVAEAASAPEPAMGSTATVEERQAARVNAQEITAAPGDRAGRVQAERAQIEMAESRRPQSADTNLPYYATRAARDVAGPAARFVLAR